MSLNAHTSSARYCVFILVANLLIQDLHHGRLLLWILDEHAPSAANILNDIDDFSEARRGAACLGKSREAEIGALAVLEDDKELDDEGHGLDLEICSNSMLAYC